MSIEDQLASAFVASHPGDAARTVQTLAPEDTAALFEALPQKGAAAFLRFLPPFVGARALERMPADGAAALCASAQTDVAAAILRVMKAPRRVEVLDALSGPRRLALRALVDYPEGTAGAAMDPDAPAVVEGAAVRDALDLMRRDDSPGLYYVYVVTADRKLSGVVSLPELLRARPDADVGSVASREVDSLSARAGLETIVGHPAWRRVHALPVVEPDGRLAGVVRYEAVRALEHRLVESASGDGGTRAGAALGELYALGFRGVLSWVATLAQGGNASSGSDS